MCEIQKENLISCQLSFTPLGKVDYIKDIENILKIIEDSNVEYEVGGMSTILKGNSRNILNIIDKIIEYSNNSNVEFTMTTIFSNT